MAETVAIESLHAAEPKKPAIKVPPWLKLMCSSVYFDTCILHSNAKKNELDRFCTDCVQSFCFNCLPSHDNHKYVKIRRYVYCEVINRQDLCKLFDCSGIQAYSTNRTKVLFLKQRPQQQLQRQNSRDQSKDYSCIFCNRSLQDASVYCSIGCKLSVIQGGEHKEETTGHHSNPKMNENGGKLKSDIKPPLPKRQKVRKGIASRAPMF